MSTEEDILQEVANNSGYGVQQILTGTGQSLLNMPSTATAPQTNYLTPPNATEMMKYAQLAQFSGYSANIVRQVGNTKYVWRYPAPFYQGAMPLNQILSDIKKGKWIKL